MRVCFLTNMVSPYRRPVFERLAATPGWEFRVIVNSLREHDRDWDVDLAELDVVRSRGLSLKRRVRSVEPVPFEQIIELHVPTGLHRDLSRFRPDVVISHELGPRTMAAAAWCALHGVPLVIWAYQSRISATQGARTRSTIRRVLLSRAATAVGMGAQAREVLRGLGVEDARIIDAPNAADHVSLERQLADPSLESRIAEIRSSVGDGQRIALVIGRLIPLKGIPEILDAFRSLDPAQRDGWRLVFAGRGPLDELVHASEDIGARAVGNIDPSETGAWYRAADLHVFPSLGDVWGLVVNEASQCSTPTLCSVHAGCADDMIEHGVDGLLTDPTDPDRLTADLSLAMGMDDLPGIGSRAAERARSFTLDRLAEAFRTAVDQAARGAGLDAGSAMVDAA